MRKATVFGGVCIVAALAVWVGVFVYRNLRGIGPAFAPVPADIAELAAENKTGLPLKIPNGFSIEIFAKDLAGARAVKFDPAGNLYVSRTGEGIITRLDIKDGRVVGREDILTGLRKPHGIAFDLSNPRVLYYAEEHRISRIDLASGATKKLADLPSGDGHFTRTLGFGPDGRLYVSIGSSCNVCREQDARRAAIWSLNKDGSDFRLFARGLRNSVFFIWHPETKEMWATEMGRDLLGDDTPPDEINIVKANTFYGWPYCYGKNIRDPSFSLTGLDPVSESGTVTTDICDQSVSSHINLQAHSAHLGLAFIHS